MVREALHYVITYKLSASFYVLGVMLGFFQLSDPEPLITPVNQLEILF